MVIALGRYTSGVVGHVVDVPRRLVACQVVEPERGGWAVRRRMLLELERLPARRACDYT